METKENIIESKIGIVGFTFGGPSTIKPNQELAQIAANLATETRGAIFTQLDMQFEDEGKLDVTRATEEAGKPPATLKIAREAVTWAMARGMTELHVVAAEPHVWRARRDLEVALKEAGASIKIHVSPEIEKHPSKFWFDKDSDQRRTKYKIIWYLRELILRCLPLSEYKKHASGGSEPLSKKAKE